MSSPRSSELIEELGPDGVELVRLVEVDCRQHEATLAEHHRTAMTIRGFALTAVAALVAAGYASAAVLPEILAAVAALAFLLVDYYYVSLSVPLVKRLRVLVSLSGRHRRLLAKEHPTTGEVDRFRGDLRSYNSALVIPTGGVTLLPRVPFERVRMLPERAVRFLGLPMSVVRPVGFLPWERVKRLRVPVLWPLGRLKAFVPLYVLLLVASVLSAIRIADPDASSNAAFQLKVVCVYQRADAVPFTFATAAPWQTPCPPSRPLDVP
jgi:hypothetical protein